MGECEWQAQMMGMFKEENMEKSKE